MDRLEAAFVLCNDRILKCCKTININWSKERSAELKEQILGIRNYANHIRKLIHDRMHNFILSMISNRVTFYQQRFPPGLSIIHAELSALTARFTRIVNHNRETFGLYYGQTTFDNSAKRRSLSVPHYQDHLQRSDRRRCTIISYSANGLHKQDELSSQTYQGQREFYKVEKNSKPGNDIQGKKVMFEKRESGKINFLGSFNAFFSFITDRTLQKSPNIA
ncbi:unnamed protein product [Onchocerca flexuosa]|uniref:Uncharacterized protein n=1 Tax=Onchocerca flexuosa TaxID=387005 RepID=A0A183H7U2_9BILA|nr:unnamed protein product [Onchocerca flexuosa]